MPVIRACRSRAGPVGNSSGDIFLAFPVANPLPMPSRDSALIPRDELNAELLDPLYLAAVEGIEEAVVNALVAGWQAHSMRRPPSWRARCRERNSSTTSLNAAGVSK